MTTDELKVWLFKMGKKGLHTIDALGAAAHVLEDVLWNEVFDYGTVRQIETKDELRDLIRRGSNHYPSPAPLAPPYTPEYLAKKARYGEFRPHKFTNHGFWYNINVRNMGNKIVMSIDDRKTKKGFDYLSHHERKRSVLKRAFHLAWQRMIREMIKEFAKK